MRATHRRLVVALAAGTACGACRTAHSASAVAVREVLSGCAGGFTGGGGGAALLPNGTLYRWTRDRAGADDRRTLVRTDTALATDVFGRLASMRFLGIVHHEPGNMTCFVRARTDSGAHEVSWPSSDTRAPRPVRDLFQRLQTATGGG